MLEIPSLLLRLSFTPEFSTYSLPVTQWGMGVGTSCFHILSLNPSWGEGLLTNSPYSSMGLFSLETILQELLQLESFPQGSSQTIPAWVTSAGCSPSRNRLLQPRLPWVVPFFRLSHLLRCGMLPRYISAPQLTSTGFRDSACHLTWAAGESPL